MEIDKKDGAHHLPPGFRFHPTDEELIIHYLRNQAKSEPCPVSIIPQVDIYKFDPWELPDKASVGEKEWYFFSPRDRKYPNGDRPNRATVSGYWKATGSDKSITSGSKCVGVKKALVFYRGRPPKGLKTDWIMHEYRLIGSTSKASSTIHRSMRLDEWVLYRIYKKRNASKVKEDAPCTPAVTPAATLPAYSSAAATGVESSSQQLLRFPRTCSLSHLLGYDGMFLFWGDPESRDDKCQQLESTQFQENPNALIAHRTFANPIVEFQ